ncbi:hypothetical protein MLP_03710 [Microlunatus phosphovorus NM-1]|uniref:eCIS core domain-containing protein n=1 Tax=Microlunatus phosphovorus (strain ATCC 700054 / DSM 10555 / JCM 9379 / NBRC 101784 / NCIMB 13414 / VKM Ac-1990 / NM-1) TaxID=1032480 RepID=F5XJ59_MICPN|nr:DUF4157 domain-containing protein [Microlunatus phosphovorus]BAK33385.1 hypothetical protein MLP_03710 [Microlunatus phosphovorus NM-1]
MHEHHYDERIETMRPPASRIDSTESRTHAPRAAAAGRTDALTADDVLGLQRSVGNAGVAQLLEDERSPVHDVISSGGRPLDSGVRGEMEARMGHDFSDVRVHDDSAAAASAQAVNAHAYTVGSNIVFQRDQYDPSSTAGKTTLAHELTHVVQQRSGPVDGTSAPGGIKVSDPSDRFEREASANADRVMSGPAPVQTLSKSGPAVQREAEEEELQGLFVQRHAGHDHDEDSVQGMFVQREGEAPEEEAEEPVQGLFVQRDGEEAEMEGEE